MQRQRIRSRRPRPSLPLLLSAASPCCSTKQLLAQSLYASSARSPPNEPAKLDYRSVFGRRTSPTPNLSPTTSHARSRSLRERRTSASDSRREVPATGSRAVLGQGRELRHVRA